MEKRYPTAPETFVPRTNLLSAAAYSFKLLGPLATSCTADLLGSTVVIYRAL